MTLLNSVIMTTMHSKLHEKERLENPREETLFSAVIIIAIVIGIFVVWLRWKQKQIWKLK